MNNGDLLDLFLSSDEDDRSPVTVIANDYRYDGWLIMIGHKRSGAMRCVIEDEFGRLFIHNPQQVRRR